MQIRIDSHNVEIYLTKTIHCFKTKNIYKMDFIIQSCKTENKFHENQGLLGLKLIKKMVVVKCNNHKKLTLLFNNQRSKKASCKSY